MLKALYDYGVRQNLTQPPGFSGKTVKAYISLSATSILAQFLLTTRQNGVIEEIQNTNQQHRIKEENHENHQ